MATKDNDDKEPQAAENTADDALLVPQGSDVLQGPLEPGGDIAPTQLGVRRYVHAVFFAAGILLAYLSGKILTTIWNALADWPIAVRAVPQLVRYPEDDRESFMLILGAVIGAITVIQVYRRERIRGWADDVAAELSQVTWPNRETVVNGTLVVVIATGIGTAYVTILDRFWGFLTNLVYGT